MVVSHGQAAVACGLCFLLGAALNPGLSLRGAADSTPTASLPFPMSARLGSNLYQQTAAEHRAVCLQTFQCAKMRLNEFLKSTKPEFSQPAVIMDLDETVLDNSSFQTYLLKNKLEYSDAEWARYEEQFAQDVTLVPGARDFIEYARSEAVTVLFLSNRSETFRDSTIAALTALKIGTPEISKQLFLKPRGGSSDKSARREQIAARFNVVMLIGDNLRDFSESLAAPQLPEKPTADDARTAIQTRQSAADAANVHWGIDWFVLPNPAYGEWDRIIGPDPIAILHPTHME